jgi:hypothetical protein
MRSVLRNAQRSLSIAVAVLVAVQAMLVAWHGAMLSSTRLAASLAGPDAAGTVVICTAHGFVRVAADADGMPLQGSGDPAGPAVKCPLCLALSADVWAPPIVSVLAASAERVSILPTARRVHVAHAPRGPPRQRGPPSLV